MDSGNSGPTQMEFQRRPGGRAGCGCCGFWFMGLLALPVLAAVTLLTIA